MSAENAPQSRCSVCAEPSPSTICRACEARIRGELLDEKGKTEKDGHADSHRH